MAAKRTLVFLVVVVVCVLLSPWRRITADEWLPIDPADLKMTSEPKAPGAPAIYLYRQVDRDDQELKESRYARIKILTEEGRKNADVELPFVKDQEQIKDLKARTIRPDGSVANFDGKVYEKTVVKAHGVKYLVKTFTLPDVQVGSIIEYRYTNSWTYYPYDPVWILSAELFTKHAKFSLIPNSRFSLRWSWRLLPDGTAPPAKDGKTIRLEAHDIPAFLEEDFMPPPNELKARVNFMYSNEYKPEMDPEKFWKEEGKWEAKWVEEYVDKPKAMERAVAQIISPNDSPEVKLQKIYARVQQLRNISFEEEKSEKETEREKQKGNHNVEDVWKNQYGNRWTLDWLFLGLVRAAGFEAYPVMVSRRNVYFFSPSLLNPKQLDDRVVLVKIGGKDLYFDPGTEFTPYGYLSWSETQVKGLKLDKEGGGWVTTSLPKSEDSVVNRVADLSLDETGNVEGKLTVTYTGLEAQERRMEERNEDEADKKEFLEDEVKGWVPGNAEVELTNKPEWKSSSATLLGEFSFKVQGWASPTGRRMLIPVAFFTAQDKHLFEHANRVHPVYFEYPFQTKDEVNVTLPVNWTIKSLPPAQNQDQQIIAYVLKVEDKQGQAHISRALKVNMLELEVKYYPALRLYFQQVKTSDEQQIVVQPGG